MCIDHNIIYVFIWFDLIFKFRFTFENAILKMYFFIYCCTSSHYFKILITDINVESIALSVFSPCLRVKKNHTIFPTLILNFRQSKASFKFRCLCEWRSEWCLPKRWVLHEDVRAVTVIKRAERGVQEG